MTYSWHVKTLKIAILIKFKELRKIVNKFIVFHTCIKHIPKRWGVKTVEHFRMPKLCLRYKIKINIINLNSLDRENAQLIASPGIW